MSINRYEAGEHPAGFVGFRVTAFNGRRWRQKYFPSRCPYPSMDPEFWVELQHLRAQRFAMLCRKYATAVDYLKFVSTPHSLASPHTSLGVHALSLYITQNKKRVVCGFTVSHGRGQGKRFPIEKDGDWFSEAYTNAVHDWADFYEVRHRDRDRLLANVPNPSVFQALRRHLNSQGSDLSPEDISEVFREQRAELARRRAAESVPDPDKSSVAADIASWFEQERQKSA